MPERFKKKKLTPRRQWFISGILACLIRLAVKIIIAYGYMLMFDKLGLNTGIWMRILEFITSYWISSMLSNWAFCKVLGCILQNDTETLEECFIAEKYTNDLGELVRNVRQLIFFTSDE